MLKFKLIKYYRKRRRSTWNFNQWLSLNSFYQPSSLSWMQITREFSTNITGILNGYLDIWSFCTVKKPVWQVGQDYAGHVKGEKNVRHFKVPMTRNFVAFSGWLPYFKIRNNRPSRLASYTWPFFCAMKVRFGGQKVSPLSAPPKRLCYIAVT